MERSGYETVDTLMPSHTAKLLSFSSMLRPTFLCFRSPFLSVLTTSETLFRRNSLDNFHKESFVPLFFFYLFSDSIVFSSCFC